MSLTGRAILIAALLGLIAGGHVRDASAGQPAPPRSAEFEPFDPIEATETYLASVPPEKRARSDAYFEGGYWLQLWSFLAGVVVNWLLLAQGWSARLRSLAERAVRVRPVQTWLYWGQYLVVTSVVTFPFAAYAGFFRERAYGLSTQTFGAWAWDQLKGLLLGLVLGGLFVMAIHAVVRRAPRTWWLWGSAVAIGFMAFAITIFPVFIAPVFNTYTLLTDERVRAPILSLARANGIEATDIYQVDASRQTTRISANVSGLFGTERITLNDNLLARCSLPEIEAVMGHEIAHYVLNHVWEGVLFFGVVIAGAFAFLRGSLEWALRRRGGSWGLGGITDIAVLPLALLLL